eukprot:SAG31_NODE_394_length_16282_cov_132.890564_8_plen_96_part_00
MNEETAKQLLLGADGHWAFSCRPVKGKGSDQIGVFTKKRCPLKKAQAHCADRVVSICFCAGTESTSNHTSCRLRHNTFVGEYTGRLLSAKRQCCR